MGQVKAWARNANAGVAGFSSSRVWSWCGGWGRALGRLGCRPLQAHRESSVCGAAPKLVETVGCSRQSSCPVRPTVVPRRHRHSRAGRRPDTLLALCHCPHLGEWTDAWPSSLRTSCQF